MRTAVGLLVVVACGLAACSGASSGSVGGWGSPGDDSTDAGSQTPASDSGGGGTYTNGDAGAQSGGSDSGSTPPSSGQDASSSTPPGSGQDSGSSTPPSPDASTPPQSGFDQFQNYNLQLVNTYRATLSVAPLVLDQTLCTFALAGSTELTQDHTPHQHFINAGNDGTLWTSGFVSAAAENQGDPNGWTVLATDATTNEMDQIQAIQAAMFAEGPGSGEAHGHYTNMMNAEYTRLGVGLVEVSNSLYLTNDFSN